MIQTYSLQLATETVSSMIINATLRLIAAALDFVATLRGTQDQYMNSDRFSLNKHCIFIVQQAVHKAHKYGIV